MKRLAIILGLMLVAVLTGGPIQHQQAAAIAMKNAGGGGGPFSVTDNFDDHTNDASLATDANWTATLGAWIVTNPTGTAGYVRGNTSGDESCIRYSGATFSANQYAEITIIDGAAQGVIGPAVRCQSASATYYGCYWEEATLRVYLFKSNSGTWTEITRYTSQTFATGNRIRIEANGTGSATRLAVYKDVGAGYVSLGTNVNPGSTYIDGGVPGVTAYDDGSDTGPHVDSWTGGDL